MSLTNYSTTYVPQYHSFVEITKEHEDAHWTENDARLQSDVEQWKNNTISPEGKEFITNILKLFTQSDCNVASDYIDNLLPVFKNNEVRNMLCSFAAREGVHQRAYALLNDTLGLPEKAYEEFLEYKEMSALHEWMLDVSSSSQKDIAIGLAKQVLVEGVCLFASFAMLLNFKRHGQMLGMGDIVMWSIHDEDLHCKGLSALFRDFLDEHPRIVNDEMKKAIYQVARDVVELEDNFVDLVFSGSGEAIKGITAEEVKQYVRYTVDYRMQQLGLKPQFGVSTTPFPWMDEMVSGDKAGQFFEINITDYSKNNMRGDYEGGY